MFEFVNELSPVAIWIGLAAILLIEAVLSFVCAVLWTQNRNLKKKLSVFFSGKEAKDLEKVLTDQLNECKELDLEIQELFEISNKLRDLCLKSIHKTSVLRFNPFKEVGGNQSFSVALLDGRNSGVVLSSLHTREGTRVYAKPITAGEASGYPLNDEEKSAVAQAISGKLPTV